MLENIELLGKIYKITTPEIFEKIIVKMDLPVFIDDIEISDKIVEFLKD